MADLHLTIDNSTDAERISVDAVLAPDARVVIHESERLVRGGMARKNDRRHLLLPALHALQADIGWISAGGLNYISDVLQVPPAEAYGVATFYELFRTEDPGHSDSTVHVCMDTSCHIAGAEAFAQALEADGKQVHRGPCLGQCERAPAQFVQGRGAADSVPADADNIASPGAFLSIQRAAGDTGGLRLLANVGVVDPTSLVSYREHGGYVALEKALSMGGQAVIDEVRLAGLTGRGGAGFPTAIKWQGVADEQGRPKHVIANADESEPGTFKDRTLMENDPFALIEGLTIAGVSVGAENGWIYIRGEYPLATTRLTNAIEQARTAGLLGVDVMGSGFDFDIVLHTSAGRYICGEETALLNALEGKRANPRAKPPFPQVSGLWGKPTIVNNVETLCNLPGILAHGVGYRLVGTERSPGTRLFCLSGHVANPGVYEVPQGTTLGEMIEIAGGATGSTRAILMGGAAGSFIDADQLDMPLTGEDTRERGTTLGSGVITLFDDTVDFVLLLTRITEFFKSESCGQCVPCRVGTTRQHEVIVEMGVRGSLSEERNTLIDDMALAMADASICGLGHTAAGAVQSAIRLGLIGSAL